MTARTRTLTPNQRAVVTLINGLIEYWEIALDELEGDLPPPAPTIAVSVVKYRHPKSGDTWDGNGQQPDWLRSALLKEGYRVSELRVSDETLNGAEGSEPTAGN